MQKWLDTSYLCCIDLLKGIHQTKPMDKWIVDEVDEIFLNGNVEPLDKNSRYYNKMLSSIE